MSKRSDDSIERIFRQALTQFDKTFKESDWLKMEKMLDEEADRKAALRSKKIRGFTYSMTGLAGLIIAVYFLAFNNPSDSTAKSNDSETEMQASDDPGNDGNVKPGNPSAGLLSETENEGSAKNTEDRSIEKAREGSELPPTADLKEQSSQNNSKNPEIEKVDFPPAAAVQEKGIVTEKPPVNSVPTGDTPQVFKAEQPVYALPKQSGNNIREEAEAASGNAADNLIDQQEETTATPTVFGETEGDKRGVQQIGDDTGQKKNDEVVVPDLSGSTENSKGSQPSGNGSKMLSDSLSKGKPIQKLQTDSVNSENLPAEKQRVKPSSRWSAAILFAPEFSTAKMSHYSAPGESFGLRIGYQVSNRFAVNAGLIRSTKKYVGHGYDYEPRNPLYWQIRTNGMVPEEIDSKCLVYELPLEVQFNAIQTPRSRVFISTGISSYFMMSQAYDYTFDDPNPGADTGWRSSGSETYWFGVGTVSAGYERNISRALALGIEPYLKVSLSEIGWPNIKLFSTGAYVTLRYKLMSKK